MRVPKLQNLQQEVAKKRFKRLQVDTKNQNILSRKYKNFELGYEVEDVTETRSNAELQQDRLYIEAQLRPKLKSLFGKDADEINAYVNYLQQNNVNLADFNTIYPELTKMGSNLTANKVITRSTKLLSNLQNTGEPTEYSNSNDLTEIIDAIKEGKKMIQEEYKDGGLEYNEANDNIHKLNAVLASTKDVSQLKNKSEYEAVGRKISGVFNYPYDDEEQRLNALVDVLNSSFNEPQKVAPQKPPKPVETEEPWIEVTPKKKKGRPKGSKNKNKDRISI